MLFNSFSFIFVFLPAVLFLAYFSRACFGVVTAGAVVMFSSLVFYGAWNWAYLFLLCTSIVGNYIAGSLICQLKSRLLMMVTVLLNLAVLGLFKYSDFIAGNLNDAFHWSLGLPGYVLPLAISFFTFQQIGYIVDCYRGNVPRYSLWQYVLFVSFFPQLIAGPILRHGEIFHQYQDRGFAKFCSRNVVVGFGIFVLGLFKKTVVGDNLGRFADPLFSAADAGVALSLFEAWAAMLFFSFQIYFDFSGYSDMAVGLARMLNVQLPFNFNSPYRSRNIVEFWRRWHITLGAFLRDYLYVPLGGNKRGTLRLLTNLFTVMCLGGIWHGAGWTFLAWGAYHGVLLMAAHGFQIFRGSSKRDYFKLRAPAWLTDVVTVLSTFLFVSFGWIFFRSADLATAFSIVQGLVGQNGTMFDFSGQVIMFSDALFGKTVSPSDVQIFPNDVADFINDGIYWLLLSAVLTFGCPSMKSILESHGKSFGDVPIVGGAFSRLLISQKNQKLVAVSVVIVFVAALLFVDVENEFLYFQF